MKKIFHYNFLFLLSILLATALSAQNRNALRVELNANLNMEDYNLVPCGENGLLVFYESNEKGTEADTRRWYFAFYDKNLQQQWIADTALLTGCKFSGHTYDNNNAWLLFINPDRPKITYNLQIVKLSYHTNVFSITSETVREKPVFHSFKNANGLGIVTLNNASYEPEILLVDLHTVSIEKVHPEVEGLNIIQDLHIDRDKNHFFVALGNYLGKKQNTILVLKMDNRGEVINIIRINPVIDNKVLNEARLACPGNDTLLITGTYHHQASRISDPEEGSVSGSAGYFISQFTGNDQKYINYYNFLEFEEMFSAMSTRSLAAFRRKAEKQKSSDGEYSLDYLLLLHEVISMNGDIVLLSEAYYPEYRTVTNMYYDYYGRPIPQTYTVFDGYKYFSGIAACFSPAGEMVWNSGVEMSNILSFKLNKHLGHFASHDELAIFYYNANRLYYKIIGDEEESGSLLSLNLEQKYKGDKLMEDLGGKVVPWYGQYFVSFGYQKIRNNRLADGNRTIFFFSKLAFQ
jgi:hypothetical protein